MLITEKNRRLTNWAELGRDYVCLELADILENKKYLKQKKRQKKKLFKVMEAKRKFR